MAVEERAQILVTTRSERGSRAARRMRRDGMLPGVLYGMREPIAFTTNERELRAIMRQGHALMDVAVDGNEPIPVIVKDQQHHPVRGGYTHVDLLEVNLKQKIHAVVPIELNGADEAPGIIQGGILEHVTREINIEALPTDIPDALHFNISALEINTSATLADLESDGKVEILDDPKTVIAVILPPKVVVETTEIEEETELVGEAESAAKDEADGKPEATDDDTSSE